MIRIKSKEWPVIGTLALALLILGANSGFAGKIRYTYDNAGRLAGQDYGAGKTTTFVYDRNGNMLNRTTGGATNADVRLSKTASVSAITAGINFTYTLTATNAGPSAALDVVITDPLPFGILFSDANSSQGAVTLSNRTVIGNVGLLAARGSATLTLSVFHGLTNLSTNIAMVSAATTDPAPANNVASVFTRGFDPSDSDNDGMPNWWETLYGLSAFSNAGINGMNGDPDGDGVGNLDEFRADTNPNDRNSFFRVLDIIVDPSAVTLTFPTSPIRRYDAQGTPALGSEPFTTIQSFNGDGSVLSIMEPVSVSNRFYRIEVKVP